MKKPYIALLLIVLPLLAIFLVNPVGEFPLNDDWAYTLSVQHFAATGHIHLSTWPAMSLVWQLIYSGLICKVIGFSFTHLREITLGVALLNNIIFYKLFRAVGTRPSLAVFATLALFFNPIYFNLAFTFMTEIHFMMWLGLSLLCVALAYSNGTTTPSLRYLVMASIAASAAFLIRQHGVLIPALFGLSQLILVIRKRVSLKTGLIATLAVSLIPFITYLAFQYWYTHIHGSTSSYDRKFDLMAQIGWKQFSLNFWGSISYLAWYVLPVMLVLIVPLRSLIVPTLILASVIVLWHVAMPTDETAIAGLEIPYRNQMPYISNVLYNFGLGPITLKDVFRSNVVPPTALPVAFWWVITGIVSAATILLSLILSDRIRSGILRNPTRLFAFCLLTALVAFEIVISPEKDGGLFDRHLLNYILPTLLLLLPTETETPPARKIPWALGVTCLLLYAGYAVAGTHDYMAWNRARWEGLQYLMTDLKATPEQIDGGFEFNGWYNSDTFPPQNNHFHYKRGGWWVVDDTYKVFWQMTPMYEDSYTVIKEIPYTAWLALSPRTIAIGKR